VGIGGIGMSVYSRNTYPSGILVSGSDISSSQNTKYLEKNSVLEYLIGHKKGKY